MLIAAIARHLATLNPALYGKFDAVGATIHVEGLPPEPQDAIGIFTKPGPVQGGVPDGYDYESFQVVVRRSNTKGLARSGYDVAKKIRDDLNGLRHIDLATGTEDAVRLIWCISDDVGPYSIGVDANGLPRWALRFNTQTAHDTAHAIV